MKIPPWLLVILRSSPVILIASATRLLLVANNDPTVATKIAASGGVAGTLLGTLIPLLPPYLPVIVVGLIVLRRPLLAAVAAGAMILVSPSPVTWHQWLVGAHDIERWWHEHSSHGGQQLVTDLATYFITQRWPVWVLAAACVCAISSAPSSLRWTDEKKLKEKVEQKLKEFQEGWSRVLRVSTDEVISYEDEEAASEYCKEPDTVYPDDLPSSERWNRIKLTWRASLLRLERKQRIWRMVWRLLYGLVFGVIAVLLVGLVMQFYAVPITGINPGILVRSMWLPTEVITVKEQPQPAVGYVLSTSDGWFVVLTERNRDIDYIPATKVIARSVCSVDEQHILGRRPLVRLYGASNSTSPKCPSIS